MELGARLAAMGAELLVETLARMDGNRSPEKQDPAEATYAPLLKKEDGLIDWRQPAASHPQSCARIPALARRLHALSRTATAHLEIAGGAGAARASPANFCCRSRLRVVCGEGALELIEVQLEGRKRIAAEAFANGQRIA